MNRKERRRRKTKPLARLGVPIFVRTLVCVLDTPEGYQNAYYWFASEMETGDLSADEVMATQELHGPFATQADADADARLAVVGDNKVEAGGMWDPAWGKPQ